MPVQHVKISEEVQEEEDSAMGGRADFGVVFKVHIWQPSAALASPSSWIPTLSKFHFARRN